MKRSGIFLASSADGAFFMNVLTPSGGTYEQITYRLHLPFYDFQLIRQSLYRRQSSHPAYSSQQHLYSQALPPYLPATRPSAPAGLGCRRPVHRPLVPLPCHYLTFSRQPSTLRRRTFSRPGGGGHDSTRYVDLLHSHYGR